MKFLRFDKSLFYRRYPPRVWAVIASGLFLIIFITLYTCFITQAHMALKKINASFERASTQLQVLRYAAQERNHDKKVLLKFEADHARWLDHLLHPDSSELIKSIITMQKQYACEISYIKPLASRRKTPGHPSRLLKSSLRFVVQGHFVHVIQLIAATLQQPWIIHLDNLKIQPHHPSTRGNVTAYVKISLYHY